MNLLSFYLDLSHSEAKRVGIPIPIEYISLNNSSYKYQACKIQSMNPYIFFENLIMRKKSQSKEFYCGIPI